MDVEGEFVLPAAPALVWLRLNDPHVLARCIPGCQRMTRVDAERFECEIRISYGLLKASFMTRLVLANVRAPDSYTLIASGQGGLAGLGEGVADVRLLPVADGTMLRYAARLSASGRISKLGSHLLGTTTRRLAEKFFKAFAASFHGALEGVSD